MKEKQIAMKSLVLFFSFYSTDSKALNHIKITHRFVTNAINVAPMGPSKSPKPILAKKNVVTIENSNVCKINH